MFNNKIAWFSLLLFSCSASSHKGPLVLKKELTKELKEISGITTSGADIWAITDKPHANVFKMDSSGNLIQEVQVTNTEAKDVEAVASDTDFLYIGDVGDNIGDRVERKIIRVEKKSIPEGKLVKVTGEVTTFTFPSEGQIVSKKDNNFDCESLISYKDSLYVFTKDREDNETRLYSLPKAPGNYTANYISTYNSKGLITDASINPATGELALIGYHKGHHYPFIIIFSDFEGNDFLSGSPEKFNLADKPWDWQLEGITYGPKNLLYFSCEGTTQVPATLYGIKRDDLVKIKKKKGQEKGDAMEKGKKKKVTDGEDESGLTTKGHLKNH